MNNIKNLITKYKNQNREILDRRPELSMYGDFTPDGIRFFYNSSFIENLQAINHNRCSLQLPDANKRKEIENEAYFLNLQNLSGREDFEEAFRLGIMTGIDETIEYIENKAIV
jgi:hypothetical protein